MPEFIIILMWGVLSKNGPIIDAFVKVFLGWSKYASPLGSVGSLWIFIFPIYFVVKNVNSFKKRKIFYTIIITAGYVCGQVYRIEGYYLATMILGCWICDHIRVRHGAEKELKKLEKTIIATACLIAIYLITIPNGNQYAGLYFWIKYIPCKVQIWWIAGWGIILFIIQRYGCVGLFLEKKLFQIIGKYSFAIYVVHWPIVISLTSAIIYYGYYFLKINYVTISFASIAVSIPIIFLLSMFAEMFIYQKLVKLVDVCLAEIKKDI